MKRSANTRLSVRKMPVFQCFCRYPFQDTPQRFSLIYLGVRKFFERACYFVIICLNFISHVSMAECNTILSAYTKYRHLG